MHAAFQLVRPADRALALRGLRVLVGGPESSPGVPARGRASDIETRLDGFLAYARTIKLDIDRQVLSLDTAPVSTSQGRITGMCLWVPAPGRTAMLFGPGQSEFPESSAATAAAVAAALDDAKAAGVVLVQAMLEPADAAGKTVFAQAGLVQLATLTYMERKPPFQPPAFELPAGITLEAYSAATHGLFRRAIAESYQETLDCPALSGLREVDDVIAGHKAVGPFDPQLWSVVVREEQPLGCLLLAEIPARRGLELVYLGLSPGSRGQGLGRILMQRVLGIASRRHFDIATLAVDAANTPAARLYRRCGYVSVAQRVAMVKRL
jgi:mycothiol synthase